MSEQEFDFQEPPEPMRFDQEGKPETAPSGGRSRSIILGIVVGIVAALIIGAAVVLFVDPFNLHLIDRLRGRYDAALAVMPPDTQLYFGVNLLNAPPEEINRLVKPFADAAEDPEMESYEDMLEQLDEDLEAEYGFTLTEDVIPWVGQYIGLGFVQFDLGSFDPFGYSTSATPDIEMIFAIEARDKEKADEFLQILHEQQVENRDEEAETSEHRGVTLTYWEGDDPMVGFAYTRYRSMVLISLDVDSLEDAIDAAKGESLADSPDYLEILDKLPTGRLFTMYTHGEAMAEIYEDFPGFEFVTSQFETMHGYGIAVSIVEAGIQLDAMMEFDPEEYEEAYGREYPPYDMESTIVNQIPGHSVMYIGGIPLEGFWDGYESTLESMGTEEDVTEAIELLSAEIGLDIKDFFEAMDGELALSILSKDLDPEADPFASLLPVDILLMMGTSRQEAVLEMLTPVANSLEQAFMIDLSPSERGNFTLYDVFDPYMGSSLFLFGVGEDHFVLTTSNDVLEASFGGGPSLADDPDYQDAVSALPEGLLPIMYFDVGGVVQMVNAIDTMMMVPIDEVEEISNPIEPWTSFCVGVGSVDETTMHVSMIAIIETE
jgi:hypothetical protein